MRSFVVASLVLLASAAACGDDSGDSSQAASTTTSTDEPVGFRITCPDGGSVTASEIAGDFLDEVFAQGRQTDVDVVAVSANEYRIGDRTKTGMLEQFVETASPAHPECALARIDESTPSVAPSITPIPAGSDLRYRVTMSGATDEPAIEDCLTEFEVSENAITRGGDGLSVTFDVQGDADSFADCVSGTALTVAVSFEAAP